MDEGLRLNIQGPNAREPSRNGINEMVMAQNRKTEHTQTHWEMAFSVRAGEGGKTQDTVTEQPGAQIWRWHLESILGETDTIFFNSAHPNPLTLV